MSSPEQVPTPPDSAPAPARRRAQGREHRAVVTFARALGQLLSRLVFSLHLGGRDRVPATGPVILAGNHASFLDGPMVFLLAPRAAVFLVKSEMFVGPLARALGWLGQVPVHRGRPDRDALHQALGALSAGRAVGVFPEGTRGAGTLEEVQHGVAYLALRSGSPIVPVACLGTVAALPRGRGLPRWRAPVTMIFGAPFHVEVAGDPRSRRAVAEAAEQIRLRLRSHLAESLALHPGAPAPSAPSEHDPTHPEQEPHP